MGFRLGGKWGFKVRSPLLSRSFPRQRSSSVRGREAAFESERVSVLSVIPEEIESLYKNNFKAYSCSFAAIQTVENGYAGRGEMEMNIGEVSQNALHTMTDDMSMPMSEDKSTFFASLDPIKASPFSLLMENVREIEDITAGPDVLRLESEILVQLGNLGALKLFHACLSRTLKAQTVLDFFLSPSKLSDVHLKDGEADNCKKGFITVCSGKKEERKLRRKIALERATKIAALSSSSTNVRRGPQCSPVSIAKKQTNFRSRRLSSWNKSEMSRGVKEIANLERIKATLEEEVGQSASFRSWAEAARIDEKVLQQHLYFGWNCRDKLLRSTRSLVLYLARNYRGMGVAFEDLIQAGKMGVLKGAEKFDHTRGYQFSTYVQYWIRKSILTLLARHSRGIQIPATLSSTISQIQKARKVLSNSLGRHADDDEIAKFTGLSLAKIRLASKCPRIVGSIDQKIGDGLSAKIADFTSDASVRTPEETVLRQHMRKDINELMRGLHPRERQVLLLRYGFCDGQYRSLEEIGRLFRVSKEWIRKIEKAALTKVQNEEACRNLSQYVDL